MEQENLPKHIAIIMDGNRRWAREKGMPVSFGHKEGAKTLEKIVRYANKIGIKYITVYAFSTENWKRAEEEVKTLMSLFQSYLDDYSKRADSENIKVKIIGSRDGLSEKTGKIGGTGRAGKHCENGFLTADEPRYPHTDQWNPWYGGYMPLLYRKSEKTGGVPR